MAKREYKPFYYVDPSNTAVTGIPGKPRFWQCQLPGDAPPTVDEMYKIITQSNAYFFHMPQAPQAQSTQGTQSGLAPGIPGWTHPTQSNGSGVQDPNAVFVDDGCAEFVFETGPNYPEYPSYPGDIGIAGAQNNSGEPPLPPGAPTYIPISAHQGGYVASGAYMPPELMGIYTDNIDEAEGRTLDHVLARIPESATLMQSFVYSAPIKWRHILSNFQPHIQTISDHLEADRYMGKFFPANGDVFRAFHLVAPEDVNVVIVGQDPYVKAGEAMGLSFSVRKGVTIPPSLKNIFKELCSDVGLAEQMPAHGDLTSWARQGVLLLNRALTVRPGSPKSHLESWQKLTARIINALPNPNIIFVLWGGPAQELIPDLPSTARYITGGHPSTQNRANNGERKGRDPSSFFGNRYFTRINSTLRELNRREIDWLSVYRDV